MKDGKSNNGLYFIVGALVIAVAVLGFMFLQSENDKPDIAIEVGEQGLSIDTD